MLTESFMLTQPTRPSPAVNKSPSSGDGNEELADQVFKLTLSENLGPDSGSLQQSISMCLQPPLPDTLEVPSPDSLSAIWLLDVEIANRFTGGVALKKAGLSVATNSKEAVRAVTDLKGLRQWFQTTKSRLEQSVNCEPSAEELRVAVVGRLTENIAEVEKWILDVRSPITNNDASKNQSPIIDTSERLSYCDHGIRN